MSHFNKLHPQTYLVRHISLELYHGHARNTKYGGESKRRSGFSYNASEPAKPDMREVVFFFTLPFQSLLGVPYKVQHLTF